MVRVNGALNIFLLTFLMTLSSKLRPLFVLKNNSVDDRIKWLHGKNGEFDLKECYKPVESDSHGILSMKH